MAKKKEIKATDVSKKPGESDKEYYIRLAKVADQRLVRLEKLSKQEGYEAITSYSYATAMNDLKNFGQKRFNAKVPDPTTEEGAFLFREKLAAVKEFLRAPSSTKQGVKSVYQKKVDTMNARYGTDFTWEDMADFFNTGYATKLFNELKASKTVMKAIGLIQHHTDEIKEGMGKNLNLKGVPEPVREMAIKILRRKRTSEAMGLSKEERANFRDAIRRASKKEAEEAEKDLYGWQQVDDENDLPF